MNPILLSLLEKEGYSDFGILSNAHDDNVMGMCFVKGEHIYFYKEDGSKISNEELFKQRESNLIVLEFSKAEKTYTIASEYICKPSKKDWQDETTSGALVVSIINGTFVPLHGLCSSRFPLAIEYGKDFLIISHSNAIVDIETFAFFPNVINGYYYSIDTNNGNRILIDMFYGKWNGMYLKEMNDSSIVDDKYVYLDKETLSVKKDVILWNSKNGDIWALINVVSEKRGFYAFSVQTHQLCKLSDEILYLNKHFTYLSDTQHSIWICSLKNLIQISERENMDGICYCTISENVTLSEGHSLTVLSGDYVIFKDEYGPIYYIYELNSPWNTLDGYCIYPTYEGVNAPDASHSVRIEQDDLYGIISLDKGRLLVPKLYHNIRFWESDGNVYSIVSLDSKKCNCLEDDGVISFEGLYVNDRILIPPCCKRIERWITDESEYHFEGNIMCEGYKNAGYIIFTTFSDTFGICYNNEILEQDGITEIERLGLEYVVVIKSDNCTLYHLNQKLFTEKCKRLSQFANDLLLMIGDDNECGLITYEGRLKLPMGNHNLSHLLFFNGLDIIILVVDYGNGIFDSRDMHSLIPSPTSHFIDVNNSSVFGASRDHLCIAYYEDKENSILFADIDGNMLRPVSAYYEPVGEVLVIPCNIPVKKPKYEGGEIEYVQESQIVYDVFDINQRTFITKNVCQNGYEIIIDKYSNIIIRKKEIAP